jgi:uncharacterized FAD-dependent dehydrogenase
MQRKIPLNLSPGEAADDIIVRKRASVIAGINPSDISFFRVIKRSVDARTKNIRVNLRIEIGTGNDLFQQPIPPFRIQDVSKKREVIIAGAGPAGLFAALRLIELGLRPVILERGRDVSSRKRDLARISREHIVNPDSNYCFGEGGAGTFSDGKLYTRSKKRGDNSRVLELLCFHGADPAIMYEAHPHLGTDKLPGIITQIRNSIIEAGGSYFFDTKVTELIIGDNRINGVVTSDNRKFRSPYLVLATGHSARDIYEMLYNKRISIESKLFAAGVRVEHPQELIDRIQYHGNQRGDFLPAASYNISKQVGGRGVYSFCMCPGGFIVPSATSQEEVVVNGMSPSSRNSPYANSGIVVEVRPEDYLPFRDHGDLAGLELQRIIEKDAWEYGGRTQKAPAQRLTDFLNSKTSSSLPAVSYAPGVTSTPLHQWLPEFIGRRLKDGFSYFGSVMKGYITSDAVLLGVESRTSSPVRIPRNPVTFDHLTLKGLYPCGEGSGYTGGIVSSAVDGIRVAEAIALETGT